MRTQEYLNRLERYNFNLGDDIARLFYFVTFCGNELSSLNLMKYCTWYNISIDTGKKQIGVLKRKGFLFDDFYYFSYDQHGKQPYHIYFPTAFRLLKFHPKMVEEFKNIDPIRKDDAKWLWNTAECIFEGKEKDIKWDSIILDTLTVDIFLQVWQIDAFRPALKLLSPSRFLDASVIILEEGMDNDSLGSDSLDILENIAKDRGREEYVRDLINFYRYIFCGDKFEPMKFLSPFWFKATGAVDALYHRDMEKCLKLFEGALKLKNRHSSIKNVFFTPILCLLLVVAYKTADTVETRKKLGQFLNKTKAREMPALAPAFIFARYSGKTVLYHKEIIISDIRQMLIYSTPASRIYATLFAYCFKIPLTDIFRNPNNIKPPHCALLRYELSSYMEIPDRDRLAGIYGGAPLFHSFRESEIWEHVLSDVISEIDKFQTKTTADTNNQRIYYRVDRNYVCIMVQSWLKSGRWGAPKTISASKFFNKEQPFMDDFDLAVARHCNYYHCDVPIERVLPYLQGCPRVFNNDGSPISIEEEKPYICLEEDQDGFYLTTNVPVEYDRANKTTIQRKDNTHFTIINIDSQQKAVLENLMRITHFPKSAESQLRSLLPKLGNILEVRSPFDKKSGSTLWKDGDTSLIVRIKPGKDHFTVETLTHPLECGARYFFPGKGDRSYQDEGEGQRYKVTRNLREERDNLREFTDFMENELELYPDKDNIYSLDIPSLLSMLEFIQERKEVIRTEWPEGKSLKIKGTLTSRQVEINFTSKEQWFEAEGHATLQDGSSLSLANLLKAIAAGSVADRYVRLGEDEYMILSESLLAQLRKIEAISRISGDGSQIPTLQIGQLASILNHTGMSVTSDGGPEKLAAAMREAADLQPEIPSGLNAVLRDYQTDGFRWMVRLDHWGAGGCLADDMGLGKTVQAITFLLHKASEGPSLVVAPASVILNWSSELARFAPSLNIRILNTAEDRPGLLHSVAAHDIVLTSYRLLTTEKDTLSTIYWNTVCLDEAHTIKNRSSATAAAAMSLSARSRLVLTGTPVQNYLGELWSIFQFINPGLLGSYQHFADRFINTASEEESRLRKQQLRRIISPFILRRTKSEVVEELPEKTDIIRRIPLSDTERINYEIIRERAKEAVESSRKVSVNILSDITRLRMTACDPALTGRGDGSRSSKTEAFLDLLGEITSGGNRTLVFSQFTSYLSRIAKELDAAGTEYFYLDGSVPVARRAQMVSEFQQGNRQVFLISLKAGGLGLNLTGANYVIHLDPWWNPAVEQQATDRAYRIGQKQNVTVYHLISENTIEEKILRLHKTKRDLADAILEGQDSGRAITLEELREMLDTETLG